MSNELGHKKDNAFQIWYHWGTMKLGEQNLDTTTTIDKKGTITVCVNTITGDKLLMASFSRPTIPHLHINESIPVRTVEKELEIDIEDGIWNQLTPEQQLTSVAFVKTQVGCILYGGRLGIEAFKITYRELSRNQANFSLK